METRIESKVWTPPTKKSTDSLGWILLLIGLIISVNILAFVRRPHRAAVPTTQVVSNEPQPSVSPMNFAKVEKRKPNVRAILKPGHSKDSFSFNKNGTITLSGNSIGACKSEDKYNESSVYISGPSNINDYYYVLCNLGDRGGVSAQIVSGQTNAIVLSGLVPANWSVGQWVSWSPDDKYALTYATGEVTMGDMVFASLSEGKSGPLSFRRMAAPDSNGSQPEVQNINEKSIKWIDSHTFTVRLTVSCNPYDVPDCNFDQVLRAYRVTVDMATGSQGYDRL